MFKASVRYFGAVVQHGSIRAAAESLHVAQSAVSRQIQALEGEVGATLLERRARGVFPTAAGELLYRYWRDATFDIERVRSEIDALQGLRRGHVRLASIETLLITVLPSAIDRFRQSHPGVTFEVQICGSNTVADRVRAADVELGLGFNLSGTPHLDVAARVREPVMAIMRPDHPLAKARELSLARIAGWPIAVSAPHSGTRRILDAAAASAGVVLQPALDTNSIELQHRFALGGQGIAFLSALACIDSLKARRLVAVRVADAGLNSGSIDIVTLSGRKLPVAAEEFIRVARAELQERARRRPD